MSANDELQAHTCEKVMEENHISQEGKKVDHIGEATEKVKKSFTEKFKNGTLEEGYYYVLNKGNSIKFYGIDYYNVMGETKYWSGAENEDIEEVIANVPTFDEMKLLALKVDCVCETIAELAVEKLQLIESLYSIKCCLSSPNIEPQIRIEKTLAQIDKVLSGKDEVRS